MAFVFDLETELPPKFQDGAGVEIIEFALGYDLESNCAIIMSVMLVPIDKTYDIRFGIRERDIEHEWKVTAPDYSIATVRRYVPKAKRSEVLALLLDSIKYLVEHADAVTLTMQTALSNLPDSAMEKYKVIGQIVQSCGFKISDQFRDETNGKNYWLFEADG